MGGRGGGVGRNFDSRAGAGGLNRREFRFKSGDLEGVEESGREFTLKVGYGNLGFMLGPARGAKGPGVSSWKFEFAGLFLGPPPSF